MILMRAVDTLMNLILMFNFLLNHHLDASRNFDFNKNKTEPNSLKSPLLVFHILLILSPRTQIQTVGSHPRILPLLHSPYTFGSKSYST